MLGFRDGGRFADEGRESLVESHDMPQGGTLVAIREAATVNMPKREVLCYTIKSGLGNKRDKHFYGPEAMGDMLRLLEGSKAYINHQTQEEEISRSEGDILRLCGYYKDCQLVEAKDRETGKPVQAISAVLVCDRSPAGDEALAKAAAAIQHSQVYGSRAELYAGISINADGVTEPRMMEVDGQMVEVNYVTSVRGVRSADVVTRPARGGEFIRFLESMRNETNQQEVNTMVTKKLAQLLESAKKLLAGLNGSEAKGVNLEEAEAVLFAGLSEVKALREAQIKLHGRKPGEAEGAMTISHGESEAEEEEEGEGEAEMEAAAPAADGEEEGEYEGEEKDGEAAPMRESVAGSRVTLREAQLLAHIDRLERRVDLRECAAALDKSGIPAEICTARELSRIADPVLRSQKLREAKWMAANSISFTGSVGRGFGATAGSHLVECEKLARSSGILTLDSDLE